ncbi:hypothetical protein GF362_03865 [Candidatus Dojkabacteria bacterium]|nr:hypothetical protein [Candidatus Dojkabacteria bacterium]
MCVLDIERRNINLILLLIQNTIKIYLTFFNTQMKKQSQEQEVESNSSVNKKNESTESQDVQKIKKKSSLLTKIKEQKKVVFGIGIFLVLGLIGFILIILGWSYFKVERTSPKPESQEQEERPRLHISPSEINVKATEEDPTGIEKDSDFIIETEKEIEQNDLEDSLMVIPETDYTVTKVEDNIFKVSMKEELKVNSVNNLDIAIIEDPEDEETKKDLSWAFQVKNPFRIIQTHPADKSSSAPANSGVEITFSHENFEDIQPYFEISPSVSGRFERARRTAVFVPNGGFQAGQLYTVRIKKGLKLNETDEKLEEDYTFQFETKIERASRPSFRKDSFEFPTTRKPTFTYWGERNQNTILVDVFQFKDIEQYANTLNEKLQVPVWAYNTKATYMQDISSLEKVLTAEVPIQYSNEGSTGYIVLPDVLPGGFYLIDAHYAEGEKIQAWFQVTDTTVFLTTSEKKSIAWIMNHQTKKPDSNATIQLQMSGSSVHKTNEQGIAEFDTPKELKDTYRSYVFKIKGEAGQVVIPTTDSYYGYYGGYNYYYDEDYYYYGNESQDYWSYVYTDRDLYKPTDTVSFWGLAKKRYGSDNTELTVKVTKSGYFDYYYNPVSIYSKRIEVSENGTFTDQVPLMNLQTGYYTISIYDENEQLIIEDGFRVETYTKPAYKISLDSNKEAYFWDEEIKIDGKTEFFEGTPVANIPLEYTIYDAPDGEVTSSEDGKFAISYKQPRGMEDHIYPQHSSVYVHPKRSEEGEIEGTKHVRVFNFRTNMKVETERTAKNKRKATVKLNKITLERLNNGTAKNTEDYLADPIVNKEIKVNLTEEWYERIEVGEYYDYIDKVNRKKYDYKRRSRALGESVITTNAKGEAIFEFDTTEDKYYYIDFWTTDVDGHGMEKRSYIYGRSFDYESRDHYYLEVTSKKDRENGSGYKLNERVDMAFMNNAEQIPSGENTSFLYLYAQQGIDEYKVQDNSRFSMTFKKEHIPNIFIKGVYFDGQTFKETGNYNIDYYQNERELDIKLTPEKTNYKPRDEIKIDVSVKDQSGKGKKSDVNFSIIDEAMFQLMDKKPYPLNSLYKNVTSGILQTYGSHIMPEPAAGGKGDTCFLPGTKILMKGFKLKNIEDVEIGDIVLTKESEESSNFVEAKVLETMHHKGEEYLYINRKLRVTPIHFMYINGQWKQARDIRAGDFMLNDKNEWVEIETIESRTGDFDIYNLEIDEYHTYFADGIFVHNKEARQWFVDTALFTTVKTDESGKGSVEFVAPDNITSWHVTSQAISPDLYAGDNETNVDVSLPFFVDLVMNDVYLEGDKPIIKARAYGDELKSDWDVEYTIEAKTLGIEGKKVKAKAFESIEFELNELKQGTHKIIVGAKVGDYEDKIQKEINIKSSFLKIQEVNFYEYSPDTKLEGSKDSPTTLTFLDENRGKYYDDVLYLQFTWGDRVDQKIVRLLSKEMFEEHFDVEEFSEEYWRPENYQTESGGISLFPYSDKDLELSAKVAAIASEKFDQLALADYFYSILDNKEEGRERGIQAVYGLAALKEPVLTYIKMLKQQNDLSVKEEIYLALASAEIGNKEYARDVYKDIIQEYRTNSEGSILIKVSDDQNENVEITALVTMLAGILNEEEGEDLYEYIDTHNSKYNLTGLEEARYLQAVLPLLPKAPVTFEYEAGSKNEKIELEKGEVYKVQLSPSELKKFKFNSVDGNLGIISTFDKAVNPEILPKDEDLSLTRKYTIGGVESTTFKDTDLVRVEIKFDIGGNAPKGKCYQVSDILPAGLKAVSSPYKRGYHYEEMYSYKHPYSIEGQRSSFCVYKNSRYKTIEYYARVVSKGTFKAETPIIQSMDDPTMVNYLDKSQEIVIE